MTGAKEVRSDRLYTRDHEWVLSKGGEVLIGISAFAVDQLGDITLVDLSVAAGQHLDGHQTFGTIESVKTLSDLFCPISATVLRINQELLDKPEWVNEDCWDKAWMIAVRPDEPPEPSDDLLEPSTYATHLDQAS